MGLYDQYLAFRLRRQGGKSPSHVALIITERDLLRRGAYDTLEAFLGWTVEYGADRVSVYVSVLDKSATPQLRKALTDIETPVPMAIRDPSDPDPASERIQIGIGLGGKEEFATAVRGLATAVAQDELAPEAIDAGAIEERLIFADEPDVVIKTGAERLSDFMIWQSVYSELYFTDVNWQNFRRRDYLRAILEYKRRDRRYGR